MNLIKRCFDILFSALVLGVGAPVFLLIAAAIRLTSKGPAFYRCERIGRGGQAIFCWKFRTMSQDAEAKLVALLANDPNLKHEWEKYSKLKNDPRVTAVGKLLRKSSMDELPQFWNVFKGDLSVVGPRPLTLQETQKYGKKKEKLLSVRPGITGIWQTSGRNLLTFEERIRLDETYIEKRSLLLDLRLIIKTVVVVLFPKGAF